MVGMKSPHLVLASLVLLPPACFDATTPPIEPVDTEATRRFDTTVFADSALPETTLLEVKAGDAQNNCPSGPGCPCAQNADCDNSLCIETAQGKQCARSCVDQCPAGLSCSLLTTATGDSFNVCLDRNARLCDPCKGPSDCKDGVCLDGKCQKPAVSCGVVGGGSGLGGSGTKPFVTSTVPGGGGGGSGSSGAGGGGRRRGRCRAIDRRHGDVARHGVGQGWPRRRCGPELRRRRQRRARCQWRRRWRFRRGRWQRWQERQRQPRLRARASSDIQRCCFRHWQAGPVATVATCGRLAATTNRCALLALASADGAKLWSALHDLGKGPDEIAEHRVKGASIVAKMLAAVAQVYSDNDNGVRYSGHW